MMKVGDKMEVIRSSFQKGKEESLHFVDFKQFNSFIQSQKNYLLPVIFEGASAAIALNSIKNNASLNHWNTFYNQYSQSYAKELHVGLGWALNESNSSLTFLHNIQPQWRWRVVDGFGYYAGLFHRRRILRKKRLPIDIPQEWNSAYLQGFGRSLWYISQGKKEELARTISLFPSHFRKDLWRGVGIALVFVGEIKTDDLFFFTRINHLNSLKQGVVLAVSSMMQSKELSKESKIIGDFFLKDCNNSIGFVSTIEQQMNSKGDNYLKLIEQSFQSIFQ